ncbi:MAG TPA: GNAT family N-acetyltransferase [Polyangiaceae bacterium]|nr:GNAT family N-acetyltransferase [Polyangiaceae bacterium]
MRIDECRSAATLPSGANFDQSMDVGLKCAAVDAILQTETPLREPNAQSGTVPQRTRSDARRLSERWWGIDWEAETPWLFGDFSIRLGSFEEALRFVGEHYAGIFGDSDRDGRFLSDPMCERKLRFYEEADVFLIERGASVVGLQVSHPTDWSTYYIRSLALLPEARGTGILGELVAGMERVLSAAGVERIVGDTTPTNVINLIAQTRLGYLSTGINNTDRWGAMVQLTKFLRDDADRVYRKQFCAGDWPRHRRSSSRANGRNS